MTNNHQDLEGKNLHNGALADLAKALGHPDMDAGLLAAAVTHSSFTHEKNSHSRVYNERLEFLGDAVLGMIMAEYLFHRYPHEQEGYLAKKKSLVVSEPVLASMAKGLGLPGYLQLGKGEEITGGRERPALVADAMEAVIGAIYLSEGYPAVREFVVGQLEKEVYLLEDEGAVIDPKSALQELTQARSQERPVYRIVKEEGPDHHKEFLVEVLFEGRRMGEGKGPTKKAAEQAAASQALNSLQPEE